MSVDTQPITDLHGRLAIVTGGAAGIGAGIAAALVEAGVRVVIANRDAQAGAAAVAELGGQGATVDFVRLDVSDEASVDTACRTVIEKHGAPWILVNNAAVFDGELLLEGTADHWDRTHSVNARGAFLMTRNVARAMVAAGEGGRIVNISSRSIAGRGVPGLTAYVASKTAMSALTMTSAAELAEHRITVNTVLPGGVITPGAMKAKMVATAVRPAMPPLGRCEPSDIAAAVLYFVSPGARFVTNQSLTVDAGQSLV